MDLDDVLKHPDFTRRNSTYVFLLPWGIEAVGGVNSVVMHLSEEMKRNTRLFPLIWVSDWTCEKPQFDRLPNGIWTMRLKIYPYQSEPGWKQSIGAYCWRRSMKRTFSSLINKLNIATVNAHYPEENMISLSELFRDSMSEYHHKLSWVFSFHGSDVCDISSKHPRDYVDALHSVMKGYRQYLPRVTVCSSVIENEIKRFFPGVSDCIIARNAVSSFKQRTAHQEFGPSLASQFKEGVPFILNVGKFTELKNQHLLLRAFDLIRDEVRHNLVLVGAHTSYFNNTLSPLIEQLGLENRVSVHKNIAPDRIGAFMGECSVFCLPSRQEGYPLVMMEAAVFGKPLVVSDNSGILECLGVDASSIDNADAYVFELSESEHLSVLNLANALRMATGVVKSEPAPLVRGINFQSTVLRERTWGKCLDAYLSASWATSLRPGGNCAGLNHVVNINDSTQDEAQQQAKKNA